MNNLALLRIRVDNRQGQAEVRNTASLPGYAWLPGSADGQRLVMSTASVAGESAFRGDVCAGQGAQARPQQVDDLLRARGGEYVRVEQVP
jgi:hypothetical protein